MPDDDVVGVGSEGGWTAGDCFEDSGGVDDDVVGSRFGDMWEVSSWDGPLGLLKSDFGCPSPDDARLVGTY